MTELLNIRSNFGIKGIEQLSRQNVMGMPPMGERPAGPPPDKLEKSGMGQLFLTAESEGEDTQEALKSFHDEVISALQNGSFDAVALAENASVEVQTLADSAGVDLETALTELSEQRPTVGYRPHQGPPPMPSVDEQLTSLTDSLSLDEEQSSSLEDILTQMQNQIAALATGGSENEEKQQGIQALLEQQYNQILSLLDEEQAETFSAAALSMM